MPKKLQHKILVTRPLSTDQAAYARELDLEPLVVPAIRFEFPVTLAELSRKLGRNPGAPWVFTSKNGVEMLRRIQESEFRIQNIPEVYAVGDKTASALKKLEISAHVPIHQDAKGLAQLIIKNELTGSAKPGIIHWCGNRSRPELKERLFNAKIELMSLNVYKTYLNEMILPEEPVEAILFYSPSAVEAFRHSGGFKSDLPELFAIGKTTAEALGMESGQHVHIPSVPSTEMLLELVESVIESTEIKEVPLGRGL